MPDWTDPTASTDWIAPRSTIRVSKELAEIAGQVETASGAPVADSVAYRAAYLLDGSDGAFKKAAETLTIGLSAAQ